MSQTPTGIVTTADREGNPKAVFFGENVDIVNAWALYLAENSVDLFSGKTLSDAFFGEYFFYVGEYAAVKDFLEQSGAQLPKSLLFLFPVSDLEPLQKLTSKLSQIKIALIDPDIDLDETKIKRLSEFFFAEVRSIFDLVETKSAPKKPLLKQIETVQTEEMVKEEFKKIHIPEVVKPQEVEIPKTTVAPQFVSEIVDSKPEKALEFNEEIKEEPRVEEIPAEFPTLTLHRPNKEIGRQNSEEDLNAKPTGGRFKTRAPLVGVLLISLIFFLLFPFLLGLGQIAFAGMSTVQGTQALKSAKYSQAAEKFKSAANLFHAAHDTVGAVGDFLPLGLVERGLEPINELVTIGEKTTRGAEYASVGGDQAIAIVKGITGKDKGVAFAQLLGSAKKQMELAEGELAVAHAVTKTAAEKKHLSYGFIRRVVGQDPLAYFESVRTGMQNAKLVLTLVPQMIGLSGNKQYLVLFQNNMELRPTGGFIGSYGILSLNEGEFKDFQVEDVYTADGALKGHIDPPLPIREHLAQEHWYLRDSNWDPQFPTSAARAAWFLDKEMSVSVDGVFAVDVTMLQYLLEALGPLKIPDYEDTITAENVFMKAQSEVHEDFFPGSTKKKDFLGAVGRSVLDKLLSGDNFNVKLVRALERGFMEKHALLFSKDVVEQQLIGQLGWGGEMSKPAACGENCFSDSFYAVDANLGVNKVNYYVARSFEDVATISEEGNLKHELSVQYKNTSPQNNDGLGGVYKNYLRLYIPVNAKVSAISQNGVAIPFADGQVASQSEAAIYTEEGYQVVAQLIEVNPGKEVTVTFVYSQELPDLFAKYQLVVRKQPGAQNESYSTTVNYPGSWPEGKIIALPGVVNPDTQSLLVKAGQIRYNASLETDRTLSLEFIH